MEFSLRVLGHFFSTGLSLEKSQSSQTFNILCLGDSFTYGWGIERSQTYPKQLERILNTNNRYYMQFKVFNLGVPGSNSSQLLKYAEDILIKYKNVDMIIILTGANDAWNLADSNIYRFISSNKEFCLANIKVRIFFSKFRIYKMLKIILLNLKGKTLESGVDPFKQIPRYENIEENILRNLLEYNLTRLAVLAKDNKIKLIFQNYPRGDLYGGKITEKIAMHFNIPFVDNAYAFNEKLKEVRLKDLFIYDNSHPNQQGYRIMAEGIYRAIRQDILR